MLRRTLGITALVATASLAWAASTPLDVKTGLWDMTYVTKMSGASMIPPNVLAKMTPAQKAKALAAASRPPTTSTDKDCITAKDLQQGAFGNKESDDECKYTPVVATASRNGRPSNVRMVKPAR